MRLLRIVQVVWVAACLVYAVVFAVQGRWGTLALFVGIFSVFAGASYAQRRGATARRERVDPDRINRLEFELGIPFSARPDEWHPPDVQQVTGGYYAVDCRDCGYRSISHTTEADAQQRAAAHYREHRTGEMAEG